MRTGQRFNRDSYVQTVLGTPGLNNYWGFDAGIPFTRFGAVGLTSTNSPTYTQKGKISRSAATFNGVNQSLFSAATIDLTATNKVSVAFWWYPNSYDLVAQRDIVGFGATPGANAWFFYNDGVTGGDPLILYNTSPGGTASRYYYPTTYGWNIPRWNHIVFVIDKSTNPDTLQVYLNGNLAIPDLSPADANNVDNFQNLVLYIASHNNVDRMANTTLDEIALFNTALTQDQITAIYKSSFY